MKCGDDALVLSLFSALKLGRCRVFLFFSEFDVCVARCSTYILFYFLCLMTIIQVQVGHFTKCILKIEFFELFEITHAKEMRYNSILFYFMQSEFPSVFQSNLLNDSYSILLVKTTLSEMRLFSFEQQSLKAPLLKLTMRQIVLSD